MILETTTDKFEIARSSDADIETMVAFVEHDVDDDKVIGGVEVHSYSSVGTGTLLAVPTAADKRRSILYSTIRNKDTVDPCDITLILDRNATDTEIHKETIRPAELLQFTGEQGWKKVFSSVADPLLRVLDADTNGQNIATVQPWFPANGAVALEAATMYLFAGSLFIARTAGTTSHTTGIGFGGTATLTNIIWWAQCGEGDVATLADSDMIVAQSAANLQVKAASTSATEVIKLTIKGIVRINAAGTFIPQFTYSAAPGGVPTIESGTYFLLDKLGGNALTAVGTWT